MGAIDISIAVQLWQVVFSAFIVLSTVIGITFSAAVTFVRRSECKEHSIETNSKFDQLYTLVREIKEDLGVLKGRSSKQ